MNSSTSSSSSSSSTQLSQISSLLSSIKSNPKDNQLFNQLFQLSSTYCSNSGPGKSFSNHPFCSIEGIQPDLDGELQTAMLRTFGLGKVKEVDDWLNGIHESIYACRSCYIGFEKAREELNKNYLWSYSPEKIFNFNAHIDQWEESIALSKLSGFQSISHLSQLSSSELFAILSLLSSSNAHKLRSKFVNLLVSDKGSHQMKEMEIPASLLSFLIDANSEEEIEISKWLRTQLDFEEFSGVYGREKNRENDQRFSQKVETVVEKIKKRMATSSSSSGDSSELKIIWETINFLVHLVPESSSSFLPLVLAHLHDRGSHFLLVLRSFSQILSTLGTELWTLMMNSSDRNSLTKAGGSHLLNGSSINPTSIVNDELPAVILSSILDNVDYLDSLAIDPSSNNAPSRELLFLWMDSMLGSLHLRAMENHQSQGNDDSSFVRAGTDGSGQFGEVFKRLANFLFERTQQSHVPRSCRLSSLEKILVLLTSYHRDLTQNELVKEEVKGGNGKGKEKEKEKETIGSDSQPVRPPAKFLAQKDIISTNHLEAIFKIFTIYAPEIASLAMKGKTRNTNEIVKSSSSSRRSALRLLKQVFERDATLVRASALELGYLSNYHSTITWKTRGKKSKDSNGKIIQLTKGPTAEQIYKSITNDFDFSSQIRISEEIWLESYKQLDSSKSDFSCCSIFFNALSFLSVFNDNGPDLEQELKNHLLKVSNQQQPKSFLNYKSNVKSVVKAISKALTSMRHEFKDTLVDYSETASENDIQRLCLDKACELFMLGLSPDPLMHKTMQTLVRSGWSDAESRADCFRVLFQVSGSNALKGLGDFLCEFILAATTLTQANEAAKWVIRSAADVLEVLCASTDGVLRSGTRYSLLSSSKESVVNLLPGIWKMMCEALSTIFTNAPRWSVLLDRAQLTAWLRDVNIFGVQLVEQLPVVQQAYSSAATALNCFNSSTMRDMNSNLALPIEVSISFLRLNQDDILHDSVNFVHRALEHFNSKNPLPLQTKTVMLDWCQKMLDQPIKERNTLLTADQLQDLQDRLDPDSRLSRQEVITIDDDDDEETEIKVKERKEEKRKKKELKQSKLPFTIVIDEYPKKKKAAPPAPSLSKAFPTSGTPVVATNNRYQGAGAMPKSKDSRTSSSTSTSINSSSTGSKLSQMRSEFNSSRNWKTSSDRTLGGSTSTSKPAAKTSGRDSKSETTDSDEDSDESGSSPTGLRALIVDREAAIKNLSKSSKLTTAPINRRSTKILSNPEQEKIKREREEQERRRMLKKPPDYTPLYESILSLNYYNDNQSLPSLSSSGAPPLFSTSNQYIDTFAPMMLLETWAQILQAKENLTMFPVEVQSRTSIDRGLEIGVTLPGEITITPQSRFNDQDIVLLREKVDPIAARNSSTPPRAVLAKVKEFRMQRMGPRMTLLCYLQKDRQGANTALVDGSKWEVGKLISLTTTHREYAALSSVPYYPLRDQIFKAQTTEKPRLFKTEVEEAQKLYGLNEPQASAVIASLKEPGFSLIQGPPGTGKTSTICGLVSAFVNNRRPHPVNIRAGQIPAAAVKKKILVCAPSNAAIDEIAKRLQTGLKTSDGQSMKLNIVRTGRDETINVSVKQISLESLIEQRISEIISDKQGNTGVDPRILQEEIRKLNSERSLKEDELNSARATSSNPSQIHHLENDLRVLKSKRSSVMAKLDEAKDKQQDNFRQRDAETRKVRVDILTEADVICSTLGSAGHESLAGLAFDFETVIIDEAAQAREVESLIPLRYNCRQCILVGDPLQLPPTVISKPAEDLKYGRSLFVRLFEKAAERVHLLSIQYRMHPEISIFPSRTFYDSKLKDGPNMARLTAQPWHADALLKPFKFFSTSGLESEGRGHSKINREEVEVALAIYQRLMRDYSIYDFDRKVGIVAAYKEQVSELRRIFGSRYGDSIFERVDFNTIDGFQGQEKSIIIFSCVRAGTGNIGFLSRFERLNVAITRAKSNLFIIGNAPELRKDQLWSRLVANAEEVGALQSVTVKTFQAPKSKVAVSDGRNVSTTTTGKSNASSPPVAPKKRTAPGTEVFKVEDQVETNSKKPKKEEKEKKENLKQLKRKEKEDGLDPSTSSSVKRLRQEGLNSISIKNPAAFSASPSKPTQEPNSKPPALDLFGTSSSKAGPSAVVAQKKVSSNPSRPSTFPSSLPQKPGTSSTFSSTSHTSQTSVVPSTHQRSVPPQQPSDAPAPAPPPKSQPPPYTGPAKPSNKALGALFAPAPRRPPPKR